MNPHSISIVKRAIGALPLMILGTLILTGCQPARKSSLPTPSKVIQAVETVNTPTLRPPRSTSTPRSPKPTITPAAPTPAPISQPVESESHVIINDHELTDQEVLELESAFQIRLVPGYYQLTENGDLLNEAGVKLINVFEAIDNMDADPPDVAEEPAATVVESPPQGVYVNDLRVPPAELSYLESLTGPLAPGYYYVDQDGNFGVVGYQPFINIFEAAQAAAPQNGGQSGSSPNTDEAAYIRQQFQGQIVLMSRRDGGALYGTYYFYQFHHCDGQNYFMNGESNKQTVMDNQQRSSWQHVGNWEITYVNGQLGAAYFPQGNNPDFIPLAIAANGQIYSIQQGLEVTFQGPAQC